MTQNTTPWKHDVQPLQFSETQLADFLTSRRLRLPTAHFSNIVSIVIINYQFSLWSVLTYGFGMQRQYPNMGRSPIIFVVIYNKTQTKGRSPDILTNCYEDIRATPHSCQANVYTTNLHLAQASACAFITTNYQFCRIRYRQFVIGDFLCSKNILFESTIS